jgi:hypothetical protein
MTMSAAAACATAAAVLVNLYCIIAVSAMYRRRNEMLVRARSPHLAVLQVIYSSLHQLCAVVQVLGELD